MEASRHVVVLVILAVALLASIARQVPPAAVVPDPAGTCIAQRSGRPADVARGAAPGEGEGAARLRPAEAWALGRPIPLNDAAAADLELVPGIGPKRAAAILRHRREVGPFRALADLQAVPGLGPATARDLAEHLTVAPAPATDGQSPAARQPSR